MSNNPSPERAVIEELLKRAPQRKVIQLTGNPRVIKDRQQVPLFLWGISRVRHSDFALRDGEGDVIVYGTEKKIRPQVRFSKYPVNPTGVFACAVLIEATPIEDDRSKNERRSAVLGRATLLERDVSDPELFLPTGRPEDIVGIAGHYN